MSKFVTLHGFGGGSGGIELNFEIVGGTTEPTNPTENMIWVNTDISINKYYFSNTQPSTSKCRYIKLQMDEINSGTTVQIGDLRFIDENDNFFIYPSNVSASSSITGNSGETAINLTDNNTSTKFCSVSWVSGSYIVIDLGENNTIDTTKYTRWQWYTANDTATSSERNLKTFSLWGSNDNNVFTLLDSVKDYTAPAQNHVVAYTGTIQIPSEWNDVPIMDGDIWIYVGSSSTVPFNVVNNITVYPLFAKQYISGAWVDVTAKSWQDGMWVDWTTYLYNAGNEFNDLTGGWQSKAWLSEVGGTAVAPTLQKNSTTMTTSIASATGYRDGAIITANDIDLTPFTKLVLKIQNGHSEGYYSGSFICIGNRNNQYMKSGAVSITSIVGGTSSVGSKEIIVDVSKITGMYAVYIGFQCRNDSTYNPASGSVTISSIELI